MVKSFEINEYKSLKETTLHVNFGLLRKYGKKEFIQKLFDLIDEYEQFEKDE